MTDDAIRARLTSWRPTMPEYLGDRSISSGYLGTSMWDGLSTAEWKRRQPLERPTTEPVLAKGAALHAWLTKDLTVAVEVAKRCKTRSGKDWEKDLERCKATGVDVLLLPQHMLEIVKANKSLADLDTPKKKEIHAMFHQWESCPEVSYRWVPKDRDGEPIEGAVCRLRQDLVALSPRLPRGLWVSLQLKTTAATGLPERAWWPYWRRYYKRKAAFYRHGMLDLFGETPFRDIYVVARLKEPYPWSWYDLADRSDELDEIWYNELVPEIKVIATQLGRGEAYGPEERGI